MLETIYCTVTLTLCMEPDLESTNCFATPGQKLRRGGGHRKINSCRKVLFPVTFNPNPHWVLFILNRYGIRGPSVRLTPKQFSLEFSARIARTDGRILLVDSRELREPATCFYWSTGRENRQPTSICRQVERMIPMRAIRKTHLQ